MCGIAGLFETTLPPSDVPNVLARMGAALHHRGPDQSGSLAAPEVRAGLVSRRLSLVDLAGGGQPVSNEDGSIHVVFNGEIYNHAELRADLLGRGHHFRSRCDTEVIVHLYEEFGLDCLEKLHGMFGLAILDTRVPRLVLARDIAGIKPLYWARTQAGIAFASEVKSLLASGLVKAEPDWSAIRAYVAAGFIPAPFTGFAGIQKLKSGGWLVAEKGQTREGYFWVPKYRKPEPRRSDLDYAEEFEHELKEAVRLHMAADTTVGAFVSGGWDSSLVASYAAPHASGPLKTFSIVFPEDPTIDESRYSRQMARHLGSDHREIEFRSEDLPALLPKVLREIEEPQTRSPIVVRHQMAKLAGENVKAVTSGEGADELFGGYGWYRSRDFTAAEVLRGVVPRVVAEQLQRIPAGRPWKMVLRVLAAADQDAVDIEWIRKLIFNATDLYCADLLDTPWDPGVLLPHPDTRSSVGDRLQRRLSLEYTGRLSDGILLEYDKVGMAHSLEGRIPFLYRPIIDLALSLPSDLKIRRGQRKFIMKHLVRDLPPEIVQRTKQGLAYPPDLRAHPKVHAFIREILLESPAPAPFVADRATLERALGETPMQSRRMRGIWSVAILQCWWNEFFGPDAITHAN